MKEIKCVENGKIYPSAKAAADDLGVSPAAITHMIKGRSKRCKKFTFEYTGRPSGIIKRGKRKKRIIRDDAGNIYESIKSLADAKGIADHRARYIMSKDREGIFRNVRLQEMVETRRAVVRVIPGESKGQVVRRMRPVPGRVVYKALDYDVPVAVCVGPTGWRLDRCDDLFAPIGLDFK